jgi:hypothetical protein
MGEEKRDSWLAGVEVDPHPSGRAKQNFTLLDRYRYGRIPMNSE